MNYYSIPLYIDYNLNQITYTINSYIVLMQFNKNELKINIEISDNKTNYFLYGGTINLYQLFKDIKLENFYDKNISFYFKSYEDHCIEIALDTLIKDLNITIEHVQKSFLENL